MNTVTRSRAGSRRRRTVAAAVITAAAVVGVTSTAADGTTTDRPGGTAYPKTIPLPNEGTADNLGYQPEGIEIVGDTAYVSSFTDGRVMKVDLRSGKVKPLVKADGDNALGLHLTGRLLLVAGQTSGEVRVYDRFTGEQLENHKVPGAELINDITVTKGTAYVTDSYRDVLYAFPVHRAGLGRPQSIQLRGDFELVRESELGRAFNSNGITALDENTLLIAQTDDPGDPYGNSSALYTVDTGTGQTKRVTVDGGRVLGADGVELRGSTLYVAQHSENNVAQLKLSRDGAFADYVRTLEDDDLAVPTNLALGRGGSLYTVNSRFDVPSSGALVYEVVRVKR